jgi:hypothetical protein
VVGYLKCVRLDVGANRRGASEAARKLERCSVNTYILTTSPSTLRLCYPKRARAGGEAAPAPWSLCLCKSSLTHLEVAHCWNETWGCCFGITQADRQEDHLSLITKHSSAGLGSTICKIFEANTKIRRFCLTPNTWACQRGA